MRKKEKRKRKPKEKERWTKRTNIVCLTRQVDQSNIAHSQTHNYSSSEHIRVRVSMRRRSYREYHSISRKTFTLISFVEYEQRSIVSDAHVYNLHHLYVTDVVVLAHCSIAQSILSTCMFDRIEKNVSFSCSVPFLLFFFTQVFLERKYWPCIRTHMYIRRCILGKILVRNKLSQSGNAHRMTLDKSESEAKMSKFSSS